MHSYFCFNSAKIGVIPSSAKNDYVFLLTSGQSLPKIYFVPEFRIPIIATMLQEEVGKAHAPAHGHPHSHSDGTSRVGMWMSLLCAIHCAALPLLMVLVPALGSSFIASEPLEWIMLGVAVGVAIWSITRGYVRDHRKSFPALLLGFSIVLVGLGHTVLPESWEPVTSVTGSLGIAAAQFVNLRLVRRFHRCEVHP